MFQAFNGFFSSVFLPNSEKWLQLLEKQWIWLLILALTIAVLCLLYKNFVLRKRCAAADMRCENYAMLTGLSKLDYFILDRNGNFLTLPRNDLTWKCRDGKPLPPESWIHPEDVAGFRRRLDSLQNEGKNYVQYTYRVPGQDGNRHFLLQALSVGLDRRIFGCVQDVTLTMKKEDHLHNMQRLVQEIVDNLPYPIFAKEVDEGFHYYFLNKAFLNQTGRSAQEALGRDDFDLLPNREDAKRVRKDDLSLLDPDAEQREFVESYQMCDGKKFRCRSLKKVVKLGDGRRMLLGISIDIAQEEAAKRVLKDALKKATAVNRAKSYFFASMSHEIRTPLNAVIGFAELLKDEALPPQVRRQYLENVSFSAQALLQLINDILDLSKLEAEQMVFTPKATDVAELCRNLCGIFEADARRRRLELRNKIGIIPLLRIDQLRIRQILLNLMGNALKFTPLGGVELRASFLLEPNSECGTLTLAVQDTGVGIAEEDQKNIFIPFVQSKAMRGTSAANNGTGLGLAIIARLLQKMDGDIRLDSTPGKGSTFTVTLRHVPIASPEELHKQLENATQEVISSQSAFSKLRVLVVDDVKMNVTVLRAMCTKVGLKNVVGVTSGAEALEKMHESKFDVVLSDMWMPEMNGEQLAKKIAEDASLRDTPIVAVTADIEPGSTFSMDSFSGILVKPVTTEKLRQMLDIFAMAKTKTLQEAEFCPFGKWRSAQVRQRFFHAVSATKKTPFRGGELALQLLHDMFFPANRQRLSPPMPRDSNRRAAAPATEGFYENLR